MSSDHELALEIAIQLRCVGRFLVLASSLDDGVMLASFDVACFNGVDQYKWILAAGEEERGR